MRRDDALIRLLTEMEGTSPKILADAELMSLLLARLRADYALCETYRDGQGAPLALPVTSLCGDRDSEAEEENMLFWREVSQDTFTSHVLRGGHFFIQERAEEVLEILSAELAAVRPRGS